jgi:glutamate synthase (NADPH/NADH) large chain
MEENKQQRGLYRREYEHDSCGIGFVADIKGRASHQILKRGLEVLERMEHRGAESADNKTGDGSGVLMQIPQGFYRKLVPGLPGAGSYGTGLFFFPAICKTDTTGAVSSIIQAKIDETAAWAGLSLAAWRDVPVGHSAAGPMAALVEPWVRQIFVQARELVSRPPVLPAALLAETPLELRLYLFRKRLEGALAADESLAKAGAQCYLPSLSSRTIVYKGMLMPNQLPDYFPELRDPGMETAVALIHSRFSTNTFPDWPLAQPFRMVAHNGEINTIKGNRFWMAAREALYEHKTLGPVLKEILPVLEPGRSDSASFDNALEFLVMTGRSLPQALMMLIPESWNDRNPIPAELKDFYAYHACLMEPWDGPASIVFCDGRYVGGTLDRNGLRPSRYTITRDDLIVMASETGVQDFSPEELVYKGRLMPGKLLLVDLEEGRIIPDEEVKRNVSQARPYSRWARENIITLDQSEARSGTPVMAIPDILFMERAFGYTREDRERLLLPMAETGQEPTSSMGTDTPLAVFSDKSQRVYAYFKQVFAQVTNPPIDSIREDLVMTLTSFVGPQGNLLEETGAACRRIKVITPILKPGELARLLGIRPDLFKSRTLDMVFAEGLEQAIDRLVAQAIDAVKDGASLLVLSDRKALAPDAGLCAIPALLAAGAVHHGLIRAGLRMKASIIMESAEPREIMHFALLFGYGADLIVPYGALASISLLCRGADAGRLGSYAEAEKRYLKGLAKAMLKVISKMGTSTLRSYRGAQIFEALGLGEAVIEKCFRGTESRIGGLGFAELEAEALARAGEARKARDQAGGEVRPEDYLLAGDGQYRWRRGGEQHAWNPETIYLLQWAARAGDYGKFKQFTQAANALNQSPHVIRGLLDFNKTPGAIPLEEVESVEEIMKRFTTGAMSFGSISREAHETIAQAMNSIQGRSNSGEGGEAPERFAPQPDGRWLRSAIKQVASARFGVTSEYLANARELQIKIAQGAKPGEGGQLPGHKVDAMIAKTRHATPGVTLISPPPHHDI